VPITMTFDISGLNVGSWCKQTIKASYTPISLQKHVQ